MIKAPMCVCVCECLMVARKRFDINEALRHYYTQQSERHSKSLPLRIAHIRTHSIPRCSNTKPIQTSSKAPLQLYFDLRYEIMHFTYTYKQNTHAHCQMRVENVMVHCRCSLNSPFVRRGIQLEMRDWEPAREGERTRKTERKLIELTLNWETAVVEPNISVGLCQCTNISGTAHGRIH